MSEFTGPEDTAPKLNIEPQSWRAWLSDPVTQEVFRALRTERADWSLRLETGSTLMPGQEVALTGKAVGAIYGLDYVLIGIEEMLRLQWEQVRQERTSQVLKREEEFRDAGAYGPGY